MSFVMAQPDSPPAAADEVLLHQVSAHATVAEAADAVATGSGRC